MTNNDIRIRFTLRLPEELLSMLQRKADAIGVSNNALILQILWEWAKETEGGRKI